ncbi:MULTISPECIES: hypothetical protein [unclassified Micromonospora]|uniref:hypothetical protein n=1 Tax=unclassified Micromonospora TaxID=2617518 RepID=UPI00098D3EC2|nr:MULTISPECIES: hypothetical protein [unclassified Micromonospora]MDI5937526.1 hypothetical protein [Micromonospora sp. DH15]OON28554.1 hypothetical protein BSA16_26205 [Micromonospora sp. Rc5]
MAIWSELRSIVRWLLRRSDPPPPPGTCQVIQAAEQAAARRRLLADAEAARATPPHCQATEILPTGTLDHEATPGRADR